METVILTGIGAAALGYVARTVWRILNGSTACNCSGGEGSCKSGCGSCPSAGKHN